MKIIISRDRKQAMIHYESGKTFSLWHGEGEVLDLLAGFLSPLGSGVETMSHFMTAECDTVSIDLSQYNTGE